MKKHVAAVVLAAGQGKRFWPFKTDKNLFPFFGKPLISHMIQAPLPVQVTELVIVSNTQNQKAFSDMRFPIPHTIVVQKEGAGMSDALLSAKKLIAGKRVLVVIGDDIADPMVFSRVIEKAEKQKLFGVLPAWHAASYFPGGYIRFRGERPIEIVEKPEEGREPSSYVGFGGQYIEDADMLLAELARVKSTEDDVYERALTALMSLQQFGVVKFDEPFVSLKYPWHVLDVMTYLLHHRLVPTPGRKAVLKHNVTIEGTVHIGNNVKIFENTKITGPCYIGDNTIIGSNNIIRESMIGDNCVTGFSTDITRSYIGNDSWFHNNYIGDSVIEGNVSMGSGAVCANLRLDEGEVHSRVHGKRMGTRRTKLGAMIAKDVRIGVHASIMPGVKVGSNSRIGAGVVLDCDLPESSFCSAKAGYAVTKNKQPVESATKRNTYKSRILL